MTELQRLFGYARPYRASLALAGALMLLEAIAALTIPWLGGKFAAEALFGPHPDLAPIVFALIAVLALQAALQFATRYTSSRTADRLLADLRLRIHDHLLALPIGFHQQRRHGEILALITDEVEQLSGFITSTLLGVVPQVLALTGAVVLMFRLDPLLALLVSLLVPVFYLLSKIIGRRLRPLSTELQQAYARAVAIAEEDLSILPAIKTFTREAEASRRYRDAVKQLMRLSIVQQRTFSAIEPVVQLTAGIAAVALLWLASARFGADRMSPAELVSFFLYAALLTRPVSALAGAYGQVQMARGTLARLHSVLQERAEPLFDDAPSFRPVRGDIELCNVSFSYPGRAPVMIDVNLRIGDGETVALIGENGVGKSTLVHLLMRLHEPDSGQIRIDGVDIATVNLRSLRRQIGIVPQHALLFNGSVKDNIALGKAGAGFREIEHAARLAQAHEFILRLPAGYDAHIGDHGVLLSGGQRQRIALARALLKDPPILVLDEATAMFDPESELAFIEDCRASFSGRTVILITHRPASLALADRVLRIETTGVVREERSARRNSPMRLTLRA